jgi:hypothetical protein
MLAREAAADRCEAGRAGRDYGPRELARTGANLLVELGPAELLDSAVIRPLAMAGGTGLLGLPWGILAGKLAADVLFYAVAILAYEWRSCGAMRARTLACPHTGARPRPARLPVTPAQSARPLRPTSSPRRRAATPAPGTR